MNALRPVSISGRFARRSTIDLLSLFVNGERAPSRKTGEVLDCMRHLSVTPNRAIVIHLEENCGANAATIADWIVEILDPYYLEAWN